MNEKCLNCGSDDVDSISFSTSGCSDAPKGKTIIKWIYWCYNCKGLYHFAFTSSDDLRGNAFN